MEGIYGYSMSKLQKSPLYKWYAAHLRIRNFMNYLFNSFYRMQSEHSTHAIVFIATISSICSTTAVTRLAGLAERLYKL